MASSSFQSIPTSFHHLPSQCLIFWEDCTYQLILINFHRTRSNTIAYGLFVLTHQPESVEPRNSRYFHHIPIHSSLLEYHNPYKYRTFHPSIKTSSSLAAHVSHCISDRSSGYVPYNV